MDKNLQELVFQIGQFFAPESAGSLNQIEKAINSLSEGVAGFSLLVSAFALKPDSKATLLLCKRLKYKLSSEFGSLEDSLAREMIVQLYKMISEGLDLSKFDALSLYFECIAILYIRVYQDDKLSLLRRARAEFPDSVFLLFLSKLPQVVSLVRKSEATIAYRKFLAENLFRAYFEVSTQIGLTPENFLQFSDQTLALFENQSNWFRFLSHSSTEIDEREFGQYLTHETTQITISALLSPLSEKASLALEEILHFADERQPNIAGFSKLIDQLIARVSSGESDSKGFVFRALTQILKLFPDSLENLDPLMKCLICKIGIEYRNTDLILESFERILSLFARRKEAIFNVAEVLSGLAIKLLQLLKEINLQSDQSSLLIDREGQDDLFYLKRNCKLASRQFGHFLGLFSPFDFCVQHAEQVSDVEREAMFYFLVGVTSAQTAIAGGKKTTRLDKDIVKANFKKAVEGDSWPKLVRIALVSLEKTATNNVLTLVLFAANSLSILPRFELCEEAKRSVRSTILKVLQTKSSKVLSILIKFVRSLIHSETKAFAWLEILIAEMNQLSDDPQMAALTFEVRSKSNTGIDNILVNVLQNIASGTNLEKFLSVLLKSAKDIPREKLIQATPEIINSLSLALVASKENEDVCEQIVELLNEILNFSATPENKSQLFELWQPMMHQVFSVFAEKKFTCFIYYFEHSIKTLYEEKLVTTFFKVVESIVEIFVRELRKIDLGSPLRMQDFSAENALDDFFGIIKSFSSRQQGYLHQTAYFSEMVELSVKSFNENFAYEVTTNVSFLRMALHPANLAALGEKNALATVKIIEKNALRILFELELDERYEKRIFKLVVNLHQWYGDAASEGFLEFCAKNKRALRSEDQEYFKKELGGLAKLDEEEFKLKLDQLYSEFSAKVQDFKNNYS